MKAALGLSLALAMPVLSTHAENQTTPPPAFNELQVLKLQRDRVLSTEYQENGKTIVQRARLILAGPAESYGDFDGPFPKCEREEPGFWTEVGVTVALEAVAVGRAAPARETAGRYVIEGLRQVGNHFAADFILEHFPPQTVASCHGVRLYAEDARFYRVRSIRYYATDARDMVWQSCSPSGGVCRFREAAWINLPAERNLTLRNGFADAGFDERQWNQFLYRFTAGAPSFLNWSKDKWRYALIVIEYEQI